MRALKRILLAEILKNHPAVSHYTRFAVEEWGARLNNGLLIFLKKNKSGLVQIQVHDKTDKRLRPRHVQTKDLTSKTSIEKALKSLSSL